MAIKTKVTESFTVTSRAGDTYQVEQHTQYATTKVAGRMSERLGRSYFKTADGRGVIKNDDDTFSIPSLGVKAAR